MMPSDLFEDWDNMANRGTASYVCGNTIFPDSLWRKRNNNIIFSEGWGRFRSEELEYAKLICVKIVVDGSRISLNVVIC